MKKIDLKNIDFLDFYSEFYYEKNISKIKNCYMILNVINLQNYSWEEIKFNKNNIDFSLIKKGSSNKLLKKIPFTKNKYSKGKIVDIYKDKLDIKAYNKEIENFLK